MGEPTAEVGHMRGPEGEFAVKLAAQPVVKLAAAASTDTKISASSAEVEITRRPPINTSAVAQGSMDSRRGIPRPCNWCLICLIPLSILLLLTLLPLLYYLLQPTVTTPPPPPPPPPP